MYIDVYRFLREMTSISEVNYESSNGNGQLFELSCPSASSTTETWTLVCQEDTYPARFSVSGNLTGQTADAYVDTFYDNGIVAFTIKDGDEPWVQGDIVTFSTKAAVYPEWKVRTVSPEHAPERPPLAVCAIKQKKPQYGSEWLGSLRGFGYLLDGPKNNSKAMRPAKKAANSLKTANYYEYTSSDANYTTYGGPRFAESLGNTDTNAPQNFAVQLWVRNVFYTKQSGRDSSYGEVLYSVTDKNSIGGTLSISIYKNQLQLSVRRYYPSTAVFLWHTTFSLDSILGTSNKSQDDWFLITVNVNRDNKEVEVYFDKSSLGTYSTANIVYTRPVIGGIGSFGDVADVVVWNSELTQSQIESIYDSADAVNPYAPEVYDAFMWDETVTLPIIDMENKDNLGNIHTLQMFPQQYPFFSYRYDSIHNTSVARAGEDPEIQHMNSLSYDFYEHQWHDKHTQANVYTLGEHPTDTVVDKYWVVATNEYVICVYKIFDQRTVQQLPVYQTFYIGRGDSLQDKLYSVVLGTYSNGNDYWYTGSDKLKSGLYYQWNCVWFGQWLWQLPTRIAAPEHRGAYRAAGNSFNVWSVFHGNHYTTDIPEGRDSPSRMWNWNNQGIYYGFGLWSPELMGTFHGLYGIQAQDTTPEDIVIIDGIEHLAYTDCTQSGENSMLLLRLE
jgi:hypothetical protein